MRLASKLCGKPKGLKPFWRPIGAVFKKTEKSRFYKGLSKIDCLKMNKKCLSAFLMLRLNVIKITSFHFTCRLEIH
ncbi:hypothetical protein BCT21_18960 [Vibrio sp. 10N.222.55.F9]|nr:hypothetical protein BCT21_18960 [Vibrio sp. 10N.222.55.F9]